MTPSGPVQEVGAGRRELFGYCMYDFANSAFTTLISTVAYSVYFVRVVVGGEGNRGDFLWSLSQISVHVILIVSAPMLGALADYSGRKKRLLLLTTLLTVTACASLGLVGPGDIALGIALLVLATVGFEAGYIFYNAFLPEVSTAKTIGRVSAMSWGTGFLGGLVALAVCIPLLGRELVDPLTSALDPAAVVGYRRSFVVVAAFFLVFSLPTFAFLRERSEPRDPTSWSAYAAAGLRRVRGTLSNLRRHRAPATFVVGAMFFYGGIETIIKFSAIYAERTFAIQGRELVLLFLTTNLVAVPGTLAAGYLADRIGGRRALLLTLAGWCGVVLLGASATSKAAFWVMACGAGIGMGSTQAIGRAFMAQITPRARRAEFFGFYLMCNKVGAILGLLAFGLISSSTGNQRIAVLAVLPFFVAGMFATRAVPPVD